MMSNKLRVAFTLFSDESWTGGVNYLLNLFSAMNLTSEIQVEPILFISPDTSQDIIEMFNNILAESPILVPAWKNTTKNNACRIFEKGILQCDHQSLSAFKSANIDAVFQTDRWYGLRFPLPTIAWIADFQHKHLGEMFTIYRRKKRDLAYYMLCKSATKIMVSSEDAGKDCQNFFSGVENKISVVPFAVQLNESDLSIPPSQMTTEYSLPEKYFYFPGQLWKHKNHLALLNALSLLKKDGVEVIIVASGNPKDGRNSNHPDKVLDYIETEGLQENFLFLGMLPYKHIMPLMRGSAAVVNPSLFEGWSTIVEEAKALGVPMLLSNLRVHQEQAPKQCLFFEPREPILIAKTIKDAWLSWNSVSRFESENQAIIDYRIHIHNFAEKFEKVVLDAVNENKS